VLFNVAHSSKQPSAAGLFSLDFSLSPGFLLSKPGLKWMDFPWISLLA
jgi:hypothetical protein